MPCERCRCQRCDGDQEEEEFRRAFARPRRRAQARRAVAPIRRWRSLGAPIVAPPPPWRRRIRPAALAWAPPLDTPTYGIAPVAEPTVSAPSADEPVGSAPPADRAAGPPAAAQTP